VKGKKRKKPEVNETGERRIKPSEVNKKFLNINEIQGSIWPLKIGLIFLTNVITFLTDVVIVHGNFFAEILKRDYACPRGKIQVIPHGVIEVVNKMNQDIAKKKLGLENKTVIMFFGYIAKYKGIETLIDGFQLLTKKHPDWFLIIGGGEHPRLKTQPSYRRYVSKLLDKASLMNERIRLTGFIPEEDVAKYFSAADLIVFPYNVIMSSSGPFALAISYKKMVIASNIPPFNELLPPQALFTKDDPQSLSERIKIILKHYDIRVEIDRKLAEVRYLTSWSEVGLNTILLYEKITPNLI